MDSEVLTKIINDVMDAKLQKHGESMTGVTSGMWHDLTTKLDKVSGQQDETKICTAILNEKMDRVFEQTTKTNGRVTKLEDQVIAVNLWQAGVIGKVSGISMVIGIAWVVISKFI